MTKKALLLILIIVAFSIFPFDVSVILNRVLGMGTHIAIFVVLVIIIFYMANGTTLSQKWNNIKRMLK